MALIKPLPQLQIRLPIVTMTGEPTTTFHRYFNTEFGGAIYRNQVQLEEAILNIQAALDAAAAAQAAADAAQAVADAAQTTADAAQTTATTAQSTATTAQAAASTAQTTANNAFTLADGITDGTTAITALNVSGTDVAPFLGKTDGSKLVMASGLDDGVVETPAIALEAVTNSDFDYVSGSISGKTTSPVVLATVVLTVASGDRVDILGNCTISSVGNGVPTGASSAAGLLSVYRDGVEISDSIRGISPVVNTVQLIISGTTAISDVPGSGTFTYTLASTLTGTTGVDIYNISNRYLVATRVKR